MIIFSREPIPFLLSSVRRGCLKFYLKMSKLSHRFLPSSVSSPKKSTTFSISVWSAKSQRPLCRTEALKRKGKQTLNQSPTSELTSPLQQMEMFLVRLLPMNSTTACRSSSMRPKLPLLPRRKCSRSRLKVPRPRNSATRTPFSSSCRAGPPSNSSAREGKKMTTGRSASCAQSVRVVRASSRGYYPSMVRTSQWNLARSWSASASSFFQMLQLFWTERQPWGRVNSTSCVLQAWAWGRRARARAGPPARSRECGWAVGLKGRKESTARSYTECRLSTAIRCDDRVSTSLMNSCSPARKMVRLFATSNSLGGTTSCLLSEGGRRPSLMPIFCWPWSWRCCLCGTSWTAVAQCELLPYLRKEPARWNRASRMPSGQTSKQYLQRSPLSSSISSSPSSLLSTRKSDSLYS